MLQQPIEICLTKDQWNHRRAEPRWRKEGLGLKLSGESLNHLSVRVPWHDAGWNGTVCRAPADNAACLVLKRVHERKNDAAEVELAGRAFVDLSQSQLPPCVAERVDFMSPQELDRVVEHPYSKSSKAHAHFAPTRLRKPPYSALAIPYRWMLKEYAKDVVEAYGIDFDPSLEDRAEELMEFKAIWVQDKRNQLAMLNRFFAGVRPEKSLCFFYSKEVPLTDDPRRAIVGVGRVLSIGNFKEYEYSGPGDLQSVLWERAVQHSIRAGFQDGFLLPYHRLDELARADESFDPKDYVALAPDEHHYEFSYGADYVTHDGAIAALVACASSITRAQEIVGGNWDHVLTWIDARLNEAWKLRGPCPGLGAALTAFGVAKGTLLVHELAPRLQENDDPWPLIDRLFRDPPSVLGQSATAIGSTLSEKWMNLPVERLALLKLVSRFDLTVEQAVRFYQPTEREKAGIDVADDQLIRNPYLFYELDRHSVEPVTVMALDRGTFPDEVIRTAHPLPEPTRLDDGTDPRRVRSVVVSVLEEASVNGDTLHPKKDVIQAIRDMPLAPQCPVDEDLMAIVEPKFEPVIASSEMKDGTRAYQVSRLRDTGSQIRDAVERRLKGRRHTVSADWSALLDARLGGPASPADEAETRAREEKVKALEELAVSRFSVLVGPAGTGKTTLLSVLCEHPQVRGGDVLLLAPTGKARVQLEKSTGIRAQTIAQFLLPIDRYDARTGAYRLSTREPQDGPKTVVIDEASMLTEEQLAAVIQSRKGIERLILAGDPRQLPPIGSGRPFVDIVARLAPDDVETRFPRIASPGYCELTIRRRQVGGARDDLLLAEWFSGQAPGAGADEIWSAVETGRNSENLRFVKWTTSQELHAKLTAILVEELQLQGIDDQSGFEKSIGGSEYEGRVFFWAGRNGGLGAASGAEAWQIFSPVRGQPHGVLDLNRLIQRAFRSSRLREALPEVFYQRKIPKPVGPEQLLYGDKVINVMNRRRHRVYPEDNALAYVANGEIGIVVGQYKTKQMKWLPKDLEVEFSSQPTYKYTYFRGEFGEEGSPPLELAYALTVHKAQGSEFGITFLVLPSPCRLLSRELLYTAFTRQRNRVVILHQGELSDLKKYASVGYSETARRLTNLFGPPDPIPYEDRFLEDRLIHRTRRGELVRSKSEVIIADLLYSKDLDYEYEQKLVAPDGTSRYPDFTIEDSETGVTVFWEHLGMLFDPVYRSRWERKLDWYGSQDIRLADQNGERQLLVTQDDERGGIDSAAIESLISKTFGR